MAWPATSLVSCKGGSPLDHLDNSFVWVANKMEGVVKTRNTFRRKGREMGINAIIDPMNN
jgi:hypothetical protein